MSERFDIGERVTGIYKTGKYIGEITESKPGRYVVQVLAVLKHPKQGDLHQAKSVNVPLFHERRALAFHEKTNIPDAYVKKYDGEVPDYKESLKQSVEEEMSALEKEGSDWAKRSLEILHSLKAEYFNK
ncbi:kinase-associated lipoprotein B [Evansella tamaricis]|uniref:Kinase-associated lipoprotein B n=1 Tax=Evansella tamaricis TaxID=2069301 RepID=A0ABS6JDM1_9BACI|nr:kinase-associated lipoprotein B [Evansella tamaricis]MBU9711778.1 kinase-associated lipoprotein B [Evansella tamaricis]